MPFDPRFVGDVTEGFGDTSRPGGYAEKGDDYGLPHVTPIKALVTGTLHVVDFGWRNTGLTAYIEMPNGWKVGIGHLASVELQDRAAHRPTGTVP